MPGVYKVQVVGRQNKRKQLQKTINNELTRLGIGGSVQVRLVKKPGSGLKPSLVLFFGGKNMKNIKDNDPVNSQLQRALKQGLVVIPIVDDLGQINTQIPAEAAKFNGFEWSGKNPAKELAHIVLGQLGIEERDRRVFISHRRRDGLAAAEQLHDELTHHAFKPFIDRFSIQPGEAVQEVIADVLEDFAFLLLLETPDAHDSSWVYDEVDYALAHAMGILILQWPGKPKQIPGSAGLPRLTLKPSDIVKDGHGYDIFTPSAIKTIIDEIEDAQACAIVRRRKLLLRGIQESARDAGASCVPLKDWALDITGATKKHSIVCVTPRLPTCEDLQHLDIIRDKIDGKASAQLVHAARHLSDSRADHLIWVTLGKRLEFFSENEIGGKW